MTTYFIFSGREHNVLPSEWPLCCLTEKREGNGIRTALRWALWEDGCWHAYQQLVLAGTDMGHNTLQRFYRYAVLKHHAAKHTHLCKEAAMMIHVLCVTRSLLEIPHQAGSCFALHCCVTQSVSACFTFISTHSLHHSLLSQWVCFCFFYSRFILDLACFTHSHTPLTIWL